MSKNAISGGNSLLLTRKVLCMPEFYLEIILFVLLLLKLLREYLKRLWDQKLSKMMLRYQKVRTICNQLENYNSYINLQGMYKFDDSETTESLHGYGAVDMRAFDTHKNEVIRIIDIEKQNKKLNLILLDTFTKKKIHTHILAPETIVPLPKNEYFSKWSNEILSRTKLLPDLLDKILSYSSFSMEDPEAVQVSYPLHEVDPEQRKTLHELSFYQDYYEKIVYNIAVKEKQKILSSQNPHLMNFLRGIGLVSFGDIAHFVGFLALLTIISKNLGKINSHWNQYQSFFLTLIYLFPGGICQSLILFMVRFSDKIILIKHLIKQKNWLILLSYGYNFSWYLWFLLLIFPFFTHLVTFLVVFWPLNLIYVAFILPVGYFATRFKRGGEFKNFCLIQTSAFFLDLFTRVGLLMVIMWYQGKN